MKHTGNFNTIILHAKQDGMSPCEADAAVRVKRGRSCDLPAAAEVIHEGVAIHFNGSAAIQLVKAQGGILTQQLKRRFTRLHLPQSLAHDFTRILIQPSGHFPGQDSIQGRW